MFSSCYSIPILIHVMLNSTHRSTNKSRKFMFISEDTIISPLGLNSAEWKQWQCELYQPCCPCCSLSTQTSQSQRYHLSPAHKGTCALLPQPPSSSSALTWGLCWDLWLHAVPRAKEVLRAYTAPSSWRWFWLLQRSFMSGVVFNSFPTFSSIEAEERTSMFKDRKTRQQIMLPTCLSITLSISWY